MIHLVFEETKFNLKFFYCKVLLKSNYSKGRLMLLLWAKLKVI